jgi:hypothetical protein
MQSFGWRGNLADQPPHRSLRGGLAIANETPALRGETKE